MLKLGHVNIHTFKLDETLAFYERVLGLQRGLAATMTNQARNAWLFNEEGRALIHINMPAETSGPPILGTLLDHIAFDCDDLDGTRKHLVALDISFVERNTGVPGLSQINLLDPNGLKLELTFGAETVRRSTC